MMDQFSEPSLNLAESSAMEFSSRFRLTASRSLKAYKIEGKIDDNKGSILSLLTADESTLRQVVPGDGSSIDLGEHVTLLLPGASIEAVGLVIDDLKDAEVMRILFHPDPLEGHQVNLLITPSGDEEFPIQLDWSSVQALGGELQKPAINALLNSVEDFVNFDLPRIVVLLGL